jgi:hypothetical protein
VADRRQKYNAAAAEETFMSGIVVALLIQIAVGIVVGNLIRLTVTGIPLSILTATVLGAAGAAIGGQLVSAFTGVTTLDVGTVVVQVLTSAVVSAIFTVIIGGLQRVKEY